MVILLGLFMLIVCLMIRLVNKVKFNINFFGCIIKEIVNYNKVFFVKEVVEV